MRRPFARPNPLLPGGWLPFPSLARVTRPRYRLLGATKSPEVNLDTPSAPEEGAPYTAYIQTPDAQREVLGRPDKLGPRRRLHPARSQQGIIAS